MAVPGTVIYFSTYDFLRDATAQRLAPDLAPMVSGATARGTRVMAMPSSVAGIIVPLSPLCGELFCQEQHLMCVCGCNIVFAATVVSPLELVRTKMQAGSATYAGTSTPL
jgi:hypothetical protein